MPCGASAIRLVSAKPCFARACAGIAVLQEESKDIKLQTMPLLGSLCLLFALALAGYCLIVGIVAAVRKDPLGDRLAETGRRAGMASFLAVTGAALALVWGALNNDFSVAYILHHSNRALPTAYK